MVYLLFTQSDSLVGQYHYLRLTIQYTNGIFPYVAPMAFDGCQLTFSQFVINHQNVTMLVKNTLRKGGVLV